MVVMLTSFLAISYYCFKRILQDHYIRDNFHYTGTTRSYEGEPMPHDMNALMWYDL